MYRKVTLWLEHVPPDDRVEIDDVVEQKIYAMADVYVATRAYVTGRWEDSVQEGHPEITGDIEIYDYETGEPMDFEELSEKHKEQVIEHLLYPDED